MGQGWIPAICPTLPSSATWTSHGAGDGGAAGRCEFGSPADEPERLDWEGPQHLVTIGYRFAMGRYAVTVSEYRRFVEATSRDHSGGIHVWSGGEWKMDASKSWRDAGFKQTDRHPVVGVSWRDAMAFCDWFGKETGKLYRLPSEAEWEYACRAGTTTPFSFGKTVASDQANYDANYTYAGSAKGVYRKSPVEMGSLPANPWGLHEVHGNVWEWLEDVRQYWSSHSVFRSNVPLPKRACL